MKSATSGNWSGSLAIPTEQDGFQLLRYQVVQEVIRDERLTLLESYRLEEDPITEEEYNAKTMVLDDLEKQFYNLFFENVPAISWNEV